MSKALAGKSGLLIAGPHKRAWGIGMDLKRELVVPNADLPFKMFVFEGKNGNYRVTKHWHDTVEIFVVFEGEIDFYINTSYYDLLKGRFGSIKPYTSKLLVWKKIKVLFKVIQ